MSTTINVLFSASDIERAKQVFVTNSSLPSNTTRKMYNQYEKYMQANGKNYLDNEMSLTSVFRRLIAYENYLFVNLEWYNIRSKHNQLVTVEDTEKFRARAAEILVPYKTLKSMTTSQKFAIASTQEQGLILVPNAPNITNALNVCYDLYDEDEHILDATPMIQKLQELIEEFDFAPYDAVVKEFKYSPSTFSAQYRPFFRANNITTGEEAYEFIKAYFSIGQYRSFWSQSKNSTRFSGRVREFNEFMKRFTDGVTAIPPYKSMSQILLFVRDYPERLEILHALTSAWSQETHMYYATLSQLDMDTLDDTFEAFEKDSLLLEAFIREVRHHRDKYGKDPDQFILLGREPMSESRMKEILKEEKISAARRIADEQAKKRITPKVEDNDINITPSSDSIRESVFNIFNQDEEVEFPDLSEQKETAPVTEQEKLVSTTEPAPAPQKTPEVMEIDPELSESMSVRLKAANERISSLTDEYNKKKKEVQEVWIQIQEQQVLANFFSSYIPEDQK